MMSVNDEQLAHFRKLASIERSAILEWFSRAGEDPLISLTKIPTIDELVVREIVNQTLEQRNQLAEFSMARLAGQGSSEDAEAHRVNADRLEFALLREISEAAPDLAVAAWSLAGRLGPQKD